MDIIARKKAREEKKEKERIEQLVREEVFRKQQTVYMPTGKKLTIILFILLAIAVPAVYLTSDVVVNKSCGIMPGLECQNLEITGTSISFEMHNFLKEQYNITATIDGCGTLAADLRPNTKANLLFNCTPMHGIVRKDIKVRYIGFSELPHDVVGKLVAKVE